MSSRSELANDDVVERLRLNTPELVDDIFQLAKDQIAFEERREAALNGKAAALLAASGLSVTVALTLGGLLLGKLPGVDSFVFLAVVGLYCSGLAFGLGAAFYALRSIRVREARGIDGNDIFSSVELDAAEAAAADGPEEGAGRRARHRYRRYLAAHVWEVFRGNARIHEDRAASLAVAQRLYVLFITAVLALGLTLAIGAAVARFATDSSGDDGRTGQSLSTSHGREDGTKEGFHQF